MGTAPQMRKAPPPPGEHPALGQRFARQLRSQSQTMAVGDLVVGTLSFFTAVGLREILREPAPLAAANWLSAAAAVLIFVVWDVVELNRSGRVASAGRAAATFLLGVAALYAVLFYDRSAGAEASRLTLLLFCPLGTVGVGLWHMIMRRNQSTRRRNLALVGDRSACEAVRRSVQGAAGVQIAEVITEDDPEPQSREAALELAIRKQVIDEVLLLPRHLGISELGGTLYQAVAEICDRTNTKLHIYTPWLTGYQHVHFDYFGNLPLLSVAFAPDSFWPQQIKRALDWLGAALLLVATAPVVGVAALAIVLESGRPVWFRQQRCGLRGRTFQLIKLRTMVPEAERRRAELADRNELRGPVFKMSNDPRVTRVGRWLRRSSIDELPQLWNVLRGEMSLVGPRPPTPEEVRQYQLSDHRRLAMKPGITGLWQVSGRNHVTDFQHRVELDNDYIRNWSLLGDLWIVLRTVVVVLRMSGA